MMARWTAQQWSQLHHHLSQPADSDIVHAVIEGAGFLEPSEWETASQAIAPWVHITSLFTTIASGEDKDVFALLRQVQRYVPADEMVRFTLCALVHTLSKSFEHQHHSMQHWNALLDLLGAPAMPMDASDGVGEWSL